MLSEIDKQRLTERVTASKLARDLLSVVENDLRSHHEKEAFLNEIIRELDLPVKPKDQPSKPETYTLQFGKFEGRMLKDIPIEYLDLLLMWQEESLVNIRAYLAVVRKKICQHT